jgi:hypothetical protein
LFEFLISYFVLEFLPWLIFGLIPVLFLGIQIGAKFSRKISPLFASRFIGWGILVLLAVRFVKAGLEFYGTYHLWLASVPSKYLLPPHTPVSYFLNYGWQRFAKDDVFAIAAGAGLFLTIIILNRIFRERFFYKEEPYLAALGTFSLGWPNWILFLGLVLIPGVLFHLGRLGRDLIFSRRKDLDFRVSFLYFWLPAAIAVFFLGAKLAQILGLGQFRI